MFSVRGYTGARHLVLGVLTVLFVVLLVSPVSATVVDTSTYRVSGSTLEEVWESIEENGFQDGDLVHAGKADVTVTYQVSEKYLCNEVDMPKCAPPVPGVGYECSLTWTVTYDIETKITLPEWPGAANACEAVSNEWGRFMDALREHEEGHDAQSRMGLDAAIPDKSFSTGLRHRACKLEDAKKLARAELQPQLDAELDRLQEAVDKANEAYDAKTQHGTQGQDAVLDTSVTCDETDAKGELEDLAGDLTFVDHKGLRKSLEKKLRAAIKSIDKNKPKTAGKQIDAFIKALKAQRGKKISNELADEFIGRAEKAKKKL